MNYKNNQYLYVFGKGGHGKVIASVLSENNRSIRSFVDDNPQGIENIDGIPVITSRELTLSEHAKLIIGIGNNLVRKKIAQEYASHIADYIKHPSSQVYNSVSIGLGTVIFAGVVVNTDAKIGKHCIINSSAVIEHNCVLEDYVHVSPNATLSGAVSVGEGTHIGSGATIINNIKIGKWVTVGAGAVIINDIPDGATVVGVPGKIINTTQVL